MAESKNGRHPHRRLGMGGATCAAGLAPDRRRILILERGERLAGLRPRRATRARSFSAACSARRRLDRRRRAAVQSRQLLLRRRQHEVLWRRADPLSRAGLSTRSSIPRARRRAGRSTTTRWSHGTPAPRRCIRCAARSARIRPSRGIPRPIPFAARARRAGDRAGARANDGVGLHPFPLPLGVDIDLAKRAATPWDAFPDTGTGKMDAETCGLAEALAPSERRAARERARSSAC